MSLAADLLERTAPLCLSGPICTVGISPFVLRRAARIMWSADPTGTGTLAEEAAGDWAGSRHSGKARVKAGTAGMQAPGDGRGPRRGPVPGRQERRRGPRSCSERSRQPWQVV